MIYLDQFFSSSALSTRLSTECLTYTRLLSKNNQEWLLAPHEHPHCIMDILLLLFYLLFDLK